MIQKSNQSSKPPSLEEHPEIKRVRRYSLVFIGINLVLCVINFLFVIHSYAASESLENQSPNSSSQLAVVIVLLIYYGFGLLVTHRYYQTGLLFFVLLGLGALILKILIIVVLLIRIIHDATRDGFVNAGIIVAIIFVSICSIVSVLQSMLLVISHIACSKGQIVYILVRLWQ
ncbi:unnamed protein product [Adineta steineri]|uniref:Uncharacterized protein n=1 Tax=Adineta steineri TaxID=433720 RepID=A0A819AS39_9BILA|nr:unnamed protein product [Adineta steineri]CAF1162113.1 unnamed protein product [Adineta steineri]CAF3610858.1 unnamed protein product [Adineta steineri]CAF3784431.1 unnamed protein product [Adineta steineri]